MKHKEITERIIGSFYETYNELGFGFLESVYEQALCEVLRTAGLEVQRQVPIPVYFRGHLVGDFRADIIVNEVVLVELKCARHLEAAHEAQVLNYLRATPIEVALLLNFGHRPEFRRLLFDNEHKKVRVFPLEPVAKDSGPDS